MKSEAIHAAACAITSVGEALGQANMEAEPSTAIDWSNLKALLASFLTSFAPVLINLLVAKLDPDSPEKVANVSK